MRRRNKVIGVDLPNFANFDIKEWVNHRYGIGLSDSQLHVISTFTLLWNAFESCFDKDVTIKKMKDRVTQLYNAPGFSFPRLQEHVDYFQGRYLVDGEARFLFNTFPFGRNLREKPFVEAVLKGEHEGEASYLQALLIIVYRFRNNLFHGEKEMANLPSQIDNFRVANSLLCTCIDIFRQH